MLTRAVFLALFFGGSCHAVIAATLDRDWARIYNRPGVEGALAIWPAPGGGVDIVANRDGEMVYLQYDQAGNLAAERATGVGTMSRVLAPDGVGGFVLAAQQDSAGQTGLVQLRVSAGGDVLWRNPPRSFIQYPAEIKVANDRVYLGINEDYYTTYDPYLVISDLTDGLQVCDNEIPGYYFRISDMEILEGGGVYLVGSGDCYCFTWIRDFDNACGHNRTSYYPGHSYGQLEQLESPYGSVLLVTSPQMPGESASFAVTWFLTGREEIPTAHVDSRDLIEGGCRAEILEKSGGQIFISGEHDAGNGGQELILGTSGISGSLDLELVRPHLAKSYEAVQLGIVAGRILLLGIESNPGGGSEARIVLLFNEERVLQDYDVDGNLVDPVGMALGVDGGIYTVGSGPPSLEGIILTKLVINGAIGVPEAGSRKEGGRLGMPSPNPAGSSVRFEYEVESDDETSLDIYDPTGRLVARLVEGTSHPGKHIAEWNTRDVAKGVYLARFRSGSSRAIRKIVVSKR